MTSAPFSSVLFSSWSRAPHARARRSCRFGRLAGHRDQDLDGMGLTGAFVVTPHAFEDPVIDDDGLVVRAPGHRLVAVETTITNITPEHQPFSTMLQVELVDSRERPWETSVFGVADRSGLDVVLAPGETRRGWVGFEVPNDADGFRLLVRGDLDDDAMSFSIS